MCERPLEMISFTGTRSLPLSVARARSVGALQEGGSVHKALTLRTQTDFDLLVSVLASTLKGEKAEDLRHFKQPYNPHRHIEHNFISEDKKRKQVLQALQKYP